MWGEARGAGGGPASGRDKRPDRIAGMFDQIAGRYDLLNRLLSAGLDRYWRWRAIRALGLTGTETLLDVCAGTADVGLAAARARRGAARVVGVDFAAAMLARGLAKVRRAGLDGRVRLVRGDAMQLPVAEACADAATVAFGIRNVEHPARALGELVRALRPGGRLAVLEFGLPAARAVRPLYLWYFHRVLPRIGRAVSGHAGAYSYLPQSVGVFPWGSAFADLLRASGFADVRLRPLSLGVVYLYTAVRPAGAPGADRTGMRRAECYNHDS